MTKHAAGNGGIYEKVLATIRRRESQIRFVDRVEVRNGGRPPGLTIFFFAWNPVRYLIEQALRLRFSRRALGWYLEKAQLIEKRLSPEDKVFLSRAIKRARVKHLNGSR